MDDNTAKVLLATLPALVTGLLTWRLTRRSEERLYSNKWWDRKAQTYDSIMGALTEISFVTTHWHDHVLGHIKLTDGYQTELIKRRGEAVDTLRKLAGTGDFLITLVAAESLRKTANSLDLDLGIGDQMAEVEKDSEAVEKCMAVIKAEAKTDLKITR